MKVLDISDFYSERGGGISCHLGLKSTALVGLGVDHRVVVPGSRDERVTLDSVDDGVRRVTAELLRVRGPAQPYDPSYHFLTRRAQVHAILLAERPDVVELNSSYLAALACFTAPPTARGRVQTYFWHSNHIDTWAKSALRRHVTERAAAAAVRPLWVAQRRLLHRCAAVITTTRWQTRELEAHGVRNVRTLPFGVDKAIYHPGRRSATRRSELLGGAPPGARLLVAVGRLSAEKRFDVVIDAFQRYRARHPAVLIVFGDGPERARLSARAAATPDVRFAGFESDPVRLAVAFASADALLHGCPHETFGLAVAEALSCALPAVVPDAGGAYENAGGPSTEAYPAGDASACADALERLLARPPAELREAALTHAATIRPQADHFRSVVELYAELCAEATAPSPEPRGPTSRA